MDYKQKYEQALEYMRKVYPTLNRADKDDAEHYFPELKESEDEKIRNFITHELACLRATDEKGSDRYNELTEAIAWLEKQGEQKPVDKVEPKFKVGDWCIDNEDGVIFQIVKVLDCTYTYKTNEDEKYSCTHYSLEEDAKLWTIKDAKDGDVLVTSLSPEGDWIGIYKESVDILGFKTYCYLSAVGEFVINPNRCRNHGTHGLHPATKEQRDLLFQKMKEAGYEWDGEKKELKKIEHKPDWSKEDERRMQQIISDLEQCTVPGFPIYIGGIELEINWLKSLKERMKGE